MKIKVENVPYDVVAKLPKYKRQFPLRSTLFWRTIMKIVAGPDLKKLSLHIQKPEWKNLVDTNLVLSL